MSMGSGPRRWGMLIVAIMGLSVAGCQHHAPSDAGMPSQAWRVMESIGDVRTTRDDGLQSAPLRPGETIGDNLTVTTSEGSLLILSRNGYQLTAGENTSFRLPAAKTASDLFLDHGWLRIRIANPVNREIRIKTVQFDINAAKATLTLRADPDSADLTVEAGSAVLATTDGRHRATLVAGATAKMDPTSGNDLMIRPASAQGFSKASTLSVTTQHPSNSLDPTAPKEAESQPATASFPDGNRASTRVSLPGNDPIILLASRPKKVDDNRPEAREPITSATRSPRKTASTSFSPLLSKRFKGSSMERGVIPSSMPEGDDDGLQGSRPHQEIDSPAFDPLQFQFDRLTEGLLDGL